MHDLYLQMRLQRLRRKQLGAQRREVQPDDGAIIVGALSSVSGIATGARLMATRLRAQGLTCRSRDLTQELHIAAKLQASKDLSPTDPLPALPRVVHFNPPHFARALSCLGRRVFDEPVVAYWAWELPAAPGNWRPSLALADEVWVPSPYVRDALLQSFGDDPVLPTIRVVPHPMPAAMPRPAAAVRAQIRQRLSLSPADFIVGFSFSTLAGVRRKNPQGLIGAFRLAFAGRERSARLLLRVVDAAKQPGLCAELRTAAGQDHHIHILDSEQLSIEDFYAAIDILASLHRAEGYGLLLAEALSRGIPVLATQWALPEPLSSHRLFKAVSSELIPVVDPQGPYRRHAKQLWAEPHMASATAGLRELHSAWRKAHGHYPNADNSSSSNIRHA
ncbi:hypothetical protein SAMN04488038_10387 [Solimonas aquatica]|uniref:Glycosyl transferase family 1 domain-containing protein n=1 Tax=Solimonas aquatica TaxID=489703 RepID=A0A1H9CKM0_9GAMM|nr:glycosyltransferase [Solimonas aquatica]SEQ01732.1 hypothetical protein SAMN04488038_10387 [Solimonas aquatica]